MHTSPAPLLTIPLLLLLSAPHSARAQPATAPAEPSIKTSTIAYEHEGVALEGFLAEPADLGPEEKRPGILVVHEWWGLNDYARMRTRKLAELGYVAFAANMYGTGKVTTHPEEARAWAGQFRENRALFHTRALAGLKQLQEHANVDGNRLAAIGYCFGGSTVMELAYQGAPLLGVVSFHGGLPVAEAGGNIKAKILVCHGASDGFVSPQAIQDFTTALTERGADWHLVKYGGAVHSFTNPEADEIEMKGIAYDEAADRRSWAHMKQFFEELFQ